MATLSLRALQEFDPRAAIRGSEADFCCPLCGQEKPRDTDHRSLSANTQSGLWECHRCHAKGKLQEFHKERPQENPKERRQRQARQAFALPPREEPKAPADPEWRKKIASRCPLAGTPGAEYLAGRGIPLALAQGAGAMFVPDYFGRPAVVFPLRDKAGAACGVHGRYTDGRSDPKSRTYPAGHNGAIYTAGALAGDVLAVTEAPIDALTLALAGLPAVLATCGTSWPNWLPLAGRIGRRVLLAHDADAGGDGAAERMRPALVALGARCERLRPASAKDWNELLQRSGIEALRAAVAPFLAGQEPAAAVATPQPGHVPTAPPAGPVEERPLSAADVLQALAEGEYSAPNTGAVGADACPCGAPAWAFTPRGRPYCQAHAAAVGAGRCPLCLSAGHTRPDEHCDLRPVVSARDYPAPIGLGEWPAPAP